MEQNVTMWMLCSKDTAGAVKVVGYPTGSAYIVRQEMPAETAQACRRRAWNLLYASDGMDEELPLESCIVAEDGELKGHLVGEDALWYADFDKGGRHENAYKRAGGRLVRLGFSRW